MSTPIQLLPGTLPYAGGCYPSDPQTLNVDIITLAAAFLNENFPGLYVGATEPAPEFRDRVWFHTVSTQLYYWINGQWQRQFFPTANSKKLIPFWGSSADVDTEDGGSPGVVGPSTGPLWVIDSTMEGRVLMGVGTVPGTTTPVVTTAIGDTGGEGQHTQLEVEVGLHKHVPLTSANGFIVDVNSGGAGTNVGGALEKVDATTGQNTGGGQPMNILQPYKAGYWLRRTARVYVPPPY